MLFISGSKKLTYLTSLIAYCAVNIDVDLENPVDFVKLDAFGRQQIGHLV